MNIENRVKKFLRPVVPALVKLVFKAWPGRYLGMKSPPSLLNPTRHPVPSYTRARAKAVYGETFKRCFEYIVNNKMKGDVLEFGVLYGYTARTMAVCMKRLHHNGHLYLYDSFEGLPDIQQPVDQQSYEVVVNKTWYQGLMTTPEDWHVQIVDALSDVIPAARLTVTKGYFEDTLDAHLPDAKAVLVHVDCDLYASAKCVLDKLLEREIFQNGTLLLFDDFNCNRADMLMGERRALTESFAAQDRFTYSPWFSYGWHGQAFFVHDSRAIQTLIDEA